TAEPAVRDQGAGFAQALRLEERRRVEHFLHSGPALRAFVDDHDDVSSDDIVSQNRFTGGVLRMKYSGSTFKLQDAFVDASGLHNAAFDGQVAIENAKPAVLAVGMRLVANAALGSVRVGLRKVLVLGKRDHCSNATRGG